MASNGEKQSATKQPPAPSPLRNSKFYQVIYSNFEPFCFVVCVKSCDGFALDQKLEVGVFDLE